MIGSSSRRIRNAIVVSFEGGCVGKLATVRELFAFLRHRKRYWLAPIVIILLGLGIMILLAEGSAIAPFIYTLF